MIANLNDIMPTLEKDSKYSNGTDAEKIAIIENTLSSENASVFKSLPALIKSQLLMDRDPHGNVQVSKIETEKLLISMVEEKLAVLKKKVNSTVNSQHNHTSLDMKDVVHSLLTLMLITVIHLVSMHLL